MAAVVSFVLTSGMVATATGGLLEAGSPSRVFDTVSIDSRTLPSNPLFIALRGLRFDGHAFTEDVMQRGAAGVLVSSAPPAAPGGVAVIVVPDTLVALQRLAHHVRRLSGARVVAITGSAGKTTTKEVTADLLASKFRVMRTKGNLNNHVGLPISLLDLRFGAEIAVVELGMNHAGEIRALVEIAEPDVRVWTNVGDAHIGAFGTREAIADAKAEILDQATAATVVVANADDALVARGTEGFIGRRITFGESEGADVRASRVVDHGFDGIDADITTAFGSFHLEIPLAGRAHLSNVLAAVCVALDAGIASDAIVSGVRRLMPVSRRGEVTTLANGARLVDDSYNASPDAVRHALRSLVVTATSGRRIAVIGEMLELGDRADDLHRACGKAAADAGVDLLVAIGGTAADSLLAGARDGGLANAQLAHFSESAEAADAVAELVRPGDLVLVKGSRGTRTDIVADRLKEAA